MMYKPNPMDTSDIALSDDLLQLTEKIAENVHEVWAQGRIADGWTYGVVRNDEKKETPCLVPYDELPERERDFDRNTALETIKLIVKMGYEIRREATSLKADVGPTPEQQEMAGRITEAYGALGVKIGPLIGVVPGEKTTRLEFAVDSEAVFPKIRKFREDVSLFLSIPPAEMTCPVPGKLAFDFAFPTKK